MNPVLESLWKQARWADLRLLPAMADAPESVRREYAHIVGAMEVWLSRIRRRTGRLTVWPEPEEAIDAALIASLHDDYSLLLGLAAESELPVTTAYRNTAGREFETPTIDILAHVPLHSQYHRGKINLLLRQFGLTPPPLDYIAWVREATGDGSRGVR